MRRTVFLSFVFLAFSLWSEDHIFHGDHLIATYYNCNEKALNNVDQLEKVMKEAVLATGATILDSISHQFTPQGFSMVILVSESHASIHTYPEHGSCFIDIFTCGDCIVQYFDDILRDYLKPDRVRIEQIKRY